MELREFFEQNPAGAVAFSGGVDSSLLVWAAAAYGADWRAYYVHTAFQPAFELADARRVAERCGMKMTVIQADILRYGEVAENPPDRCYHCKRRIFSAIRRRAAADGYDLLIDGTNASDDAGDRPGMRALRELQVRSPLRECGLTKAEVRERCRKAGLPVWDKPAYACLATRVPAGTAITAEALQAVEQAEDALFRLGFTDFRVRLFGAGARIQVPDAQMAEAVEKRDAITAALRPYFGAVMLDLQGRRG